MIRHPFAHFVVFLMLTAILMAGCGKNEKATGGMPGSPAGAGSTAGGSTGTEMTGQAGGEPAAAGTIEPDTSAPRSRITSQ